MEQKELFENEFDRQYVDSYREGNSSATNPDHQLPGNSVVESSGQSLTPVTSVSADEKELAQQVAPKKQGDEKLFGYALQDFINTMLPDNAPEGSRHKFALRLFYDLLILCDGDHERARSQLLAQQWVQDIVQERGMAEIDRIVESARKLLHKRESENLTDPQPSKEMRRAIKQVTGREYSILLREELGKVYGKSVAMKQDILQTLERFGRELEKFFPHYPLLKLLCSGLKRKYYATVFFAGGAFAMNLITRCHYYFWPNPGKQCRLNHLLMIIGRMGGGKRMVVDLYKIMMLPIKQADAAQIMALNNWNREKDQNAGSAKNKSSRPIGIYRALPSETSTAALREAEANAHETLDGEDYYLHVSSFDSELQNTLSQLKKGYMDALQTYWLKSFHNEPHGAYLKTSNAPVGEPDVHFSAVYTGTDDALKKLNTESNFVNGLLSRFTIVPNADSNFEMLVPHVFDEDALRDWAYKLDACKGDIPCESISEALKAWTARRMADAKDNDDLAEEDIIKRPCWHAINYALPFVVSRHWDKMVRDSDGRWKCGADFKVDKNDVRLAILVANAQLAFQDYYTKGIGEKHYDNAAAEQASNVRHQKKTQLAYRRLPEIFTSEDVRREYSYESVGSVCSRLKLLQDDGLAQKIRTGSDKGKYRKLA